MAPHVQRLTPMRTAITLICISVTFLVQAFAQDQEPVISKDSISVHRVDRGNMPLYATSHAGSITSLQPARVIVTLGGERSGRCEAGRGAKIQLDPPKVIAGKVVNSSRAQKEAGQCEIEL